MALGLDPDVAFGVDDDGAGPRPRGRPARCRAACRDGRSTTRRWRARQRRTPSCWTGSSKRRAARRVAQAHFPPGSRARRSPHASPPRRSSTPWLGSCRSCGAAQRTSAGPTAPPSTAGGSFLPVGSPMPDADPYGRVIHFGVREHAMGAVLNGISLHGLTRSFGGTFLVFSDYMRAPVRLAGLMGLPSLFIWTHDSVGVGEDGPTHQPIEHLWALRAIPGFSVVRPADGNETAEVWATALQGSGPHGADPDPPEPAHPRQVPGGPATDTAGAPTSSPRPAGGTPQVLLLATGSEVSVAMGARDLLEAEGVRDTGRVDAVPRVVRGPAERVPRLRCCHRLCTHESASRRAVTRAGGSTSAARAHVYRSTTSGPRCGRTALREVRVHR